LETKEKVSRLDNLKKDAEQQGKNSDNRENRLRRQAEIAEAAADDDRNMRAMQIREGLMLHRLLFFLLGAKLQGSIRQFAVTDEAFRKIKNLYGLIEPGEMIEKMLTKEQTYNELLVSVGYNKERIQEQFQRIEDVQIRIEQLTENKPQTSNPNNGWKEILGKTAKETGKVRAKLVKLEVAKNKIQTWCGRVLEKLGIDPEADSEKPLQELFSDIKSAINRIFLSGDKSKFSENCKLLGKLSIPELLRLFAGAGIRKRTLRPGVNSDDNLMKDLAGACSSHKKIH
jgi:hypothetical protein